MGNQFTGAWKNISVTMAEATNGGMQKATNGNFKLAGDKRYSVIKLKGGADVNNAHYGVLATTEADVPVGVLVESFDEAGVTSTVAYKGVVPLIAGAAITAGQKVSVHSAGKIKPTVAGKPYVGVALNSGVVGASITVLLQGGRS